MMTNKQFQDYAKQGATLIYVLDCINTFNGVDEEYLFSNLDEAVSFAIKKMKLFKPKVIW